MYTLNWEQHFKPSIIDFNNGVIEFGERLVREIVFDKDNPHTISYEKDHNDIYVKIIVKKELPARVIEIVPTIRGTVHIALKFVNFSDEKPVEYRDYEQTRFWLPQESGGRIQTLQVFFN